MHSQGIAHREIDTFCQVGTNRSCFAITHLRWSKKHCGVRKKPREADRRGSENIPPVEIT